MTTNTSRRHFFFGSLLAGAVPAGAFGSVKSLKQLGYKSPNEKLNVAAIGAGGKGYSDCQGCASENIVALADPDDKRAERTYKEFPKAKTYRDFRQMFDKQGREIDAVIVATPDHMHGTASMWSIIRGKHVYCQKPLTRTVWEARQLELGAAKYGVATQMGNQGYSTEGARQCCEIVWSGDIGDVKEVHAFTNRPLSYWPQGPGVKPNDTPTPAGFDWNVWLGGSEQRPFSDAYIPIKWRGYQEFGCGAIGDMACHILGTPNMALRLTAPTAVECVELEGKAEFTFPARTVIRFDFPARGTMPPVKIFWHDGMKKQPDIPGVPAGEMLGDSDINGSVLIGDKGMVTTGCYGERTRLVPVAKMSDYKLPAPSLTRSPGHYRDWLRACKGGQSSCSDFSIAAPFVQWMLLGVVAMRYQGPLQWDAKAMRFTNNNEANRFLKPVFRKGWKFAG